MSALRGPGSPGRTCAGSKELRPQLQGREEAAQEEGGDSDQPGGATAAPTASERPSDPAKETGGECGRARGLGQPSLQKPSTAPAGLGRRGAGDVPGRDKGPRPSASHKGQKIREETLRLRPSVKRIKAERSPPTGDEERGKGDSPPPVLGGTEEQSESLSNKWVGAVRQRTVDFPESVITAASLGTDCSARVAPMSELDEDAGLHAAAIRAAREMNPEIYAEYLDGMDEVEDEYSGMDYDT